MLSKTCFRLKMVMVGFDGAGKTSLYHTFARKTFPIEYVPSCFEGYVHGFLIDGKAVELAFWDTVCGENDEYARLRPLSYHDSDVFVLCFDVSSVESFSGLKKYFVDDELRKLHPKVPIILVATKTDLRGGIHESVTTEEGELLAAEIGSAGYFEVSSLKMEGLDELFHNICLVGMKQQEKNIKRKRCTIL